MAEAAVAGGADLLGMAGGDGSLAIVASVASRHDLPFVVVPAGTRNHFALDLGIDREDVRGRWRPSTTESTGGWTWPRSTGGCSSTTRRWGCTPRSSSRRTTGTRRCRPPRPCCPTCSVPGPRPLDLHYTLPSGEEAVPGQLLLVSNNPYDLAHLRGGRDARDRLDSGVLGVVSLRIALLRTRRRLLLLEMTGQVQRFAGWNEWTASAVRGGLGRARRGGRRR